MDMKRDRNDWRRLAIGASGAITLLVARLVLIHAGGSRSTWEIVRGFCKDPFGETHDEEIERRLSACEAHLQTLPPERITPEPAVPPPAGKRGRV